MILLGSDCAFDVVCDEMTPAMAAAISPDGGRCWWRHLHSDCGGELKVFVKIRFRSRMGIPSPLAENVFNFCDRKLFRDPGLLCKEIVPHMLASMAAQHDLVFSSQENRDDLESWFSWVLYEVAKHAGKQGWVGVGAVIEVFVPHPSDQDEDALLDWVMQESLQDESFGWIPAPKSAIGVLDKRVFELGSGLSSCLICLEDFEAGEELMELPCSHGFHGGCIVEWLRNSGVCPLCRFVLKDDGMEEHI